MPDGPVRRRLSSSHRWPSLTLLPSIYQSRADLSNLMAREEMVNLGLGDVGTDNPIRPPAPGTTGTASPSTTSKPANPQAERI